MKTLTLKQKRKVRKATVEYLNDVRIYEHYSHVVREYCSDWDDTMMKQFWKYQMRNDESLEIMFGYYLRNRSTI